LKIFKHILRWLVWSIVTLLVLGMTMPRLPVVQTLTASKAEQLLSDMLGTEVHIGRIDLGLFNRVIIDNVVVKDQTNQDMLRVNRLSAKIDLIALTEGRIAVSSAQLFGANIKLYRKDSTQAPNFQFVINALSSKDTLSRQPLDIRINSFIIRQSALSYDQLDVPVTKNRLNPQHLHFTDISTHIILKSLTDDSLNINLKRLSFNEQSGLKVNRLSCKFEQGPGSVHLSDFSLKLPHSVLEMSRLAAIYDSQRFKETLCLKGEIDGSVLSPTDFAFLHPILSHYSMPLDVRISFDGPLSRLVVSKLQIGSSQQDFYFDAHGHANLLSSAYPCNVQINRLATSEDLLAQLQSDFRFPQQIANIGRTELSCDLNRTEEGDMDMDTHVTTELGRLTLKVNTDRQLRYSGHIETDGLQLNQLFDNSQLGLLAMKADVSGTPSTVIIRGDLSRLEYNGYPYQHITLDGAYSKNEVGGRLKVDDEHLKTDVEGRLNTEGKQTALRLTGFIETIAPAALHLSDQWGEATFRGVIDADFTASNFNDAQGTIDIDDFLMEDSTSFYRIDNIHVKSGYEDGKHFLKVNGDMGEVELRGHFDWETIPQSFINYLADKLPTLPGLPTATYTNNNDFDIMMHLNDTEWMKRLLGIPLSLDKPLYLFASVDDQRHEITVNGEIPAFTYNESYYQGGSVNISSPADSMRCDISLTKQMEDGKHMDLKLQAIAADNNLSTNFNWDNHEHGIQKMSGTLNAITRLAMGEREVGPEAHVHVQRSSLMMGESSWNIEPCDILYSDGRLVVDHFLIMNNQQHLLIDGIATHHTTDTLTIDMNEIEVAYVLDLVDFHSVEFSGAATGKVMLTHVFDTPALWGHLDVGNFRFENGRMGTLHADVEWNEQDEQIDIHALADDGDEAKTYIDGYVSPARDYIDLDIRGRGTYIEFMNSFAGSFLSEVTGHATGDLKLAGPLSTINLTGELLVDGRATVTALGTTYRLQGDTVRFIPDDILLDSIRVYDRYDNMAYLSGGIHHEHLTSLTFDLDVVTSNLLAYDFHDFGESSFYGTVYAAGHVDLHGRPGEVVINCDVTPQENTTFTYNAASTDIISNQEFIVWRNAAQLPVSKGNKYSENAPSNEPTEEQRTDIYINFLVNTTPESEVRLLMDDKTDDYITLFGSGSIRADFYNKGAFHMFGTYMVDHGTYGITIQNIIKKNFTFENGGTIVFGGDPFDAALNLQAVYVVNGVSMSDLNIGNSYKNNTVRVNCLMNILGQARSPRVEFDLDMPTVNSEEKQMIRSVITSEQEMNQQVLYLLGVGRFYTQGNNNASSQQYNQTSLAMQSFLSGTVSTQINEVLSQVIKSNDWNFGANISTGNEGWHNAEYEGLVSGRMLNNRLLINGQFGYRDNATQANPSFIGDFDIRYLLYPSGNLALKVYNQTNDRYFTRSSLNTQGIGLIMKKDFNGLADLLRPRKKKGKQDN